MTAHRKYLDKMNILLLFFLAVGCVLVLTANINPVQASVEAVEDIELDPISYYELFGVAKEDCDDKKLMKKIYRKKALEFHPDKTVRHEDETDDAFAMRKRLNELTFVKLAHAYEILCDPILRNRYDYLVAQNILDYKEQDWNSMENERYHGRTFHGQDAQRVFEEAEEREVYAFIFSFALSGLVACLPSYYAWKAKQAKKVKMVVPTSDLKEAQKQAKLAREERDRERQEELEYQRELRKHRKLVEAEEEDDERENGGSDGIVEVVKKEKTKGKGKFHCVYCNKKFKSEKQHENHVKSKAHIKAEKQALRKQAKADKKASKGQNQPVNEKDADADADEAYELAALNAASKKKRKKKQQKRGGRTTEVGATDARAVSLLKQLDEDMEEKVAGTEKMSKREIAKLKQHKRKKAKQGAKKSTPTPNDGDSDEN